MGTGQPEGRGGHSRERKVCEPELGDTACLGSKLSLLPSSVGRLNNALDAYPHVFKVLLSTFDFISKAWAIYILMTFEIALLPLPLHWLGTA